MTKRWFNWDGNILQYTMYSCTMYVICRFMLFSMFISTKSIEPTGMKKCLSVILDRLYYSIFEPSYFWENMFQIGSRLITKDYDLTTEQHIYTHNHLYAFATILQGYPIYCNKIYIYELIKAFCVFLFDKKSYSRLIKYFVCLLYLKPNTI